MSTDISMNKRALRKVLKGSLAAISKESIVEQTNRSTEKLLSLDVFKSSRSVAAYLNMPSGEIQTNDILRASFEGQKQVFLPKIDTKSRHMDMIQVDSMQQVLDLAPHGPYNLREPQNGRNARSMGLDLIIVPGLAFTSKCQRIGHGKGYYDTYIREFRDLCNERNVRPPVLIGIGLKEQLVNELPLEKHDELLDGIIIDGVLYER